MLERLRNLFSKGAHGDAADDDKSVALSVAALLVEAARADQSYTDEERRLIDGALAANFGVAPEKAAAIRAEAEALQANANDIYKFTKGAKSLAPPQKVALIETLWRIVLSDAGRDPFEDTLIRRVAGLLHVSDVESGHARQRVAEE